MHKIIISIFCVFLAVFDARGGDSPWAQNPGSNSNTDKIDSTITSAVESFCKNQPNPCNGDIETLKKEKIATDVSYDNALYKIDKVCVCQKEPEGTAYSWVPVQCDGTRNDPSTCATRQRYICKTGWFYNDKQLSDVVGSYEDVEYINMCQKCTDENILNDQLPDGWIGFAYLAADTYQAEDFAPAESAYGAKNASECALKSSEIEKTQADCTGDDKKWYAGKCYKILEDNETITDNNGSKSVPTGNKYILVDTCPR